MASISSKLTSDEYSDSSITGTSDELKKSRRIYQIQKKDHSFKNEHLFVITVLDSRLKFSVLFVLTCLSSVKRNAAAGCGVLMKTLLID